MSDFIKYLEEVVWPTEQEKNTELWDVSGILKNHSNQSWVILDNDSLINYIIDNQIKVIHMETLLKELDWTMEIPKNG